MNLNVKVTVDEYELHSCDQHLISEGEHVTLSIVVWDKGENEKPYCYSIAYWVRDKEGYYLQFVGGRPFNEDMDVTKFWPLLEIGQKILDAYFDSTYDD